MTVSAWWVFWSFLGGSCAGVLLMSLMFVASAEDDREEPTVNGRLIDPAEDVHVPA